MCKNMDDQLTTDSMLIENTEIHMKDKNRKGKNILLQGLEPKSLEWEPSILTN